MYRKIEIRPLSWIFVGLLLLTVFVKVLDKQKGINTLPSELFTIDQEAVSSIIVKPKMLNGKSIELKRQDDTWQVLSDGKSYNGDANTVNRILTMLNGLKPIRLASQSKDRWKAFELTDSMATEVQFMGAKGELASLYIGKFSYTQAKQNPMMQQQYPYGRPQGTMTSYVRYNKHKEVYAVDGFLASQVNRDVDAFRDKTLLKVNKNKLSKLVFTYPDNGSFTMEKQGGHWLCDGTPLDSTAVAQYLSRISSLKGSHFAKDEHINASHKLQLFMGKSAPLELNATLMDDKAKLISSQNEGSCFEDKRDVSFDKIFISKQKLLK